MNPNLVDYGLGEEWVDLDSPASDDPDDGYAGISNQQVADEIERLRKENEQMKALLKTSDILGRHNQWHTVLGFVRQARELLEEMDQAEDGER